MAAKRVRNYEKEYEWQSRPEQMKARAARNAARRELMREGKVRKGDGKDVDHVDSNPRNNSRKNLRVRSRTANRSDHRRVY